MLMVMDTGMVMAMVMDLLMVNLTLTRIIP